MLRETRWRKCFLLHQGLLCSLQTSFVALHQSSKVSALLYREVQSLSPALCFLTKSFLLGDLPCQPHPFPPKWEAHFQRPPSPQGFSWRQQLQLPKPLLQPDFTPPAPKQPGDTTAPEPFVAAHSSAPISHSTHLPCSHTGLGCEFGSWPPGNLMMQWHGSNLAACHRALRQVVRRMVQHSWLMDP